MNTKKAKLFIYPEIKEKWGDTNMVKVSIDIDRDLHKAIKKKAIDRDVTMKVYIVEVLRRDIEVEGED